MSTDPSPLCADQRGPFVWAHRGASALAPENTLVAFALAEQLGAGGIELDVRLTTDGVPVIFHDRALWTDGVGLYCRPAPSAATSLRPLLIGDCSWAQLSGAAVVHEGGERAPLTRLEEVFETFPRTLWIDVEVKAGRDFDDRLAAVVARCIKARPERVLASSFDHLVLRELGRRVPGLPLLAIFHGRPIAPAVLLETIPTSMVCIDRPFLGRADIDRWRDEGIEVSVGALDERFDLAEVMAWPLAGVFVDNPDLALAERATV